MTSNTRGKRAWLITEDDFERISRLSRHLSQERKQKLQEVKKQTGENKTFHWGYQRELEEQMAKKRFKSKSKN